jgi:hypothetical protein
VRNALAYATHKFFQDHGFVWVSSPIITASDCEGAGEQFYVTTLVSISTMCLYRQTNVIITYAELNLCLQLTQKCNSYTTTVIVESDYHCQCSFFLPIFEEAITRFIYYPLKIIFLFLGFLCYFFAGKY